MAGNARDLELRIVTRDEVDTAQAARQIENVGDAAQDAGRQLDDQADAAQRAERATDSLAGSAAGAAGDLDRLGSAGGSLGSSLDDGVSDGAEAAGESVETMKDEAGAALLELAGSFDGTMSGLLDTVQGAIPAIGAAFGPIGLAAGAAVGIGIGFARAQVEALKESAGALASQLIADGGRLSRDSVLAKVEEMAADGSIRDLADQAREAAVDVGDFMLALGGDASAAERTSEAIARRKDEIDDARRAEGELNATRENANFDEIARLNRELVALDEVEKALGQGNEARDLAVEAYDAYSAATQAAATDLGAYSAAVRDAAAEQERANEVLGGFAGPADAYSEALARKSEAETTALENTRLTTDEFLAELRRQVEAQESWADNLDALAQRGVEDGVLDELRRMGPEAAPLIADLVQATDDQLGELEGLSSRRTRAATDAVDREWERAKGPVSARATELGAAAASGLAGGLAGSVNRMRVAADESLRQVQASLDARPLIVRTRIDPSGYDSGLRTMVRGGAVAV